MPESRIRSSEFAAPFHGVRAAHGVEAEPEALARAYAVKMRRDAAFSHVTAAQLLGVPLPVRFTASPLHLIVPTGTAPVRGRGIVGHHLSFAADPVDVRGLRVLSPAEAWVTLGEMLDVADLVAAADALLSVMRGRSAWCRLDDLASALAAHPRVRGRRALQMALTYARPGAASRPESLLRLLLVAAGFPEPELNFRVPGLPYLIDLAWPAFRLGVEYDGGHHRSVARFGADLDRQELIHDEEWFLMRVQKEHLFGDPLGVIDRARRRLAARGFIVPRREISHMVLPRA